MQRDTTEQQGVGALNKEVNVIVEGGEVVYQYYIMVKFTCIRTLCYMCDLCTIPIRLQSITDLRKHSTINPIKY